MALEFPKASIRQVCAFLDVDRDGIAKAIALANVQPCGKGARGHATYNAGEVVKALLARRGDVAPENLSPADRRNLAIAKRQELELEIRGENYLPREAVRSGVSTAFATVAQALRSIPDLVERKAGASPEVCELVERVIDSVQSDLAERLEALHTKSKE